MESLDLIAKGIEFKLEQALTEFKAGDKWSLDQIAKVHKVIGDFNNECIALIINMTGKDTLKS